MPDSRRILVTGGSGILGTAIRPHVPDGVAVYYPDRTELNVSVPGAWGDVFDRYDPTEVWHFAAETPCNSDLKWYLDVNILGTAYAALYCQDAGARLVYTSTDYVFGKSPDTMAPYEEDDPLQPWNCYAWSKLAGEAAVRMVKDHLIIRGSWYGDETFVAWDRAASDALSSKYYVTTAAKDIADLALNGIRGTVHIGMLYPRSLRHIAHVAGRDLPGTSAEEVNVPLTTALDTAKCRTLLSRLQDQIKL